jgi:hypothetical protein
VLADQLLAAHRGRNLSEIFGFAAQDVEPVQYPLLIERDLGNRGSGLRAANGSVKDPSRSLRSRTLRQTVATLNPSPERLLQLAEASGSTQ